MIGASFNFFIFLFQKNHLRRADNFSGAGIEESSSEEGEANRKDPIDSETIVTTDGGEEYFYPSENILADGKTIFDNFQQTASVFGDKDETTVHSTLTVARK